MATQNSIISDVGTLLKIPTKVSNELIDKACLCIGSAINEAKNNGETQLTLGIGIGSLSIDLIDMQCKFVPNKNLKTAIKDSINGKTDILELAIEQSFTEKLLDICSEVL